MGLISALALIVCGVLAAASAIVKKRPDAQQFIDKLVPYQGWIGVVVCIWGVITTINALIHVGWIKVVAIWWLTYLLTGLLSFALGFILGFALISKYALSKSAEAEKRGQQLREKLVTWQIPLGYAGIILGLWCLIAVFIW